METIVYKACLSTTTINPVEGEINGNEVIVKNTSVLPKEGVNYVFFPSWNEAHRYLYNFIQSELNLTRDRLKNLIDKQTKLESFLDRTTYIPQVG